MTATVILTYVLFILPVQFLYHSLWGKEHFLFEREVPVECEGKVYMVKTRCRNFDDFKCELITEHMGNDLPIPPAGEGYRVNGQRV